MRERPIYPAESSSSLLTVLQFLNVIGVPAGEPGTRAASTAHSGGQVHVRLGADDRESLGFEALGLERFERRLPEHAP